MTALRPFFLLMSRASVFWLSVVGLFAMLTTLVGLAQPDERLVPYVDPIFMAAFGFPVLAGLLAGAVIQEFQHTTFASILPGVRSRVAPGFLAAGLAVTVVVVGLIALISTAPRNLALLFVVGLGAYCLGGVLLDPLSNWITCFNTVLVLSVIAYSRIAARIVGDHPWATVVVSFGIGAVCCYRLFARSTFRRKPFRDTPVLPGRFSFEKSQQQELRRIARDGRRRKSWRAGYLGSDSWRWVRAAIHEAHGFRGWTGVSRSIGRAWGLGVLVMLYAWADKGDMGFGEALARSIYDALFRSPHQPQFGEEGGPYPLVAIALSAAGVVTALFATVALDDARAYPLSRGQRARIRFSGGLVDGAIFLFIVGPCLFALGHLLGWLVGYELRFDFIPHFFRVIVVTLILMPFAHWGRLRLLAAMRRRSENTMIGVIFGICGFVIAACTWVFLSPRVFRSPVVELATLAVALLASQLIYRHKLTSYYRTADLA